MAATAVKLRWPEPEPVPVPRTLAASTEQPPLAQCPPVRAAEQLVAAWFWQGWNLVPPPPPGYLAPSPRVWQSPRAAPMVALLVAVVPLVAAVIRVAIAVRTRGQRHLYG